MRGYLFDEEGEFAAAGVDSSVLDQSCKRCLTKYHTKLNHYPYTPK